MMKRTFVFGLFLGIAMATSAQEDSPAKGLTAANLPTSGLISPAGPSFVAPHSEEGPSVIVLGG